MCLYCSAFANACADHPPVRWSSSIFHELLKRQRDASILKSYREVLLRDVFGRAFKRYFKFFIMRDSGYCILIVAFCKHGIGFCFRFSSGTVHSQGQKSFGSLLVGDAAALASVARFHVSCGKLSDEAGAKLFDRLSFSFDVP